MYVCVCTCMPACMCACMCTSMHVCAHVCACMCACMPVMDIRWMDNCICPASEHIYINILVHTHRSATHNVHVQSGNAGLCFRSTPIGLTTRTQRSSVHQVDMCHLDHLGYPTETEPNPCRMRHCLRYFVLLLHNLRHPGPPSTLLLSVVLAYIPQHIWSGNTGLRCPIPLGTATQLALLVQLTLL